MDSLIERLIKKSTDKLSSYQVEEPLFDVKVLLSEVLDCYISDLIYYPDDISPEQLKKFEGFLDLRCRHIPVDKIIGHRGFYKNEFIVNNDVLSPRPDTEILVEAAIKDVKNRNYQNLLELGVGSGCIILSLLADCPELRGLGIDISDAALNVAAKNAKILEVENRIVLKQANWFDENFLSNFESGFDIIISNPPYISSKEIDSLDLEVRQNDPILALDGGKDGLDSYLRMAYLLPSLLNNEGRLYLEVGENQAEAVVAIFEKHNFKLENILKDYNGIKRCVVFKK